MIRASRIPNIDKEMVEGIAEFFTLLGYPNGSGIVRVLIDYYTALGYNTITGVRVLNFSSSIMYLSRILTMAERNYLPTELEIAGFVWTIKKVRHMVESSKLPVVVQTDHSAILDIMRQSSITSTTSTLRLNVRLVRASQFLRQFRLEVRHKAGKEHIVPDALSRLASCSKSFPAYSIFRSGRLRRYSSQQTSQKGRALDRREMQSVTRKNHPPSPSYA